MFLVGKGVTYDTGGLSLKISNSMNTMYTDKGGACAVFGAFTGIVSLGLPKNVTMVVALAENSIGPDAYKPSDIIKSLKGLSVEITNTDAEGRLILADAMTYIQRNYGCKRMVELSTLTGAVLSALGTETAGLYSNDSGLSDAVLTSAQKRRICLADFFGVDRDRCPNCGDRGY